MERIEPYIDISGNILRRHKINNLNEFVSELRRYKKVEIVNTGSDLLWDVFRNRNNYSDEVAQIINSYAPKLIVLALSTANDYRSNVLNPNKFYKLCHDYLNIKDPISDKQFLEKESQEIIDILKNKKGKSKIISDLHINEEIVRSVCSITFISRLTRQQHEAFIYGLNEFYMTYDVLMRLNKSTNELLNTEFQEIFDVKPLNFMRSAFGIFSLGNNKNGKILFEKLTSDAEIKKKLEIDIDSCRSAAQKLSCDESNIKENWYKKAILTQPGLYQKYYPTPLYKSPIITMNLSNGIDCLIPSPGIYIRGTNDCIFSKILAKNQVFSSDIGNVIEDHIFVGLKKIFGEERVSKISESSDRRSADFYIDLTNCDLIIECKSALGAYSDLSIMSPQNIVDIWSRLYSACDQCATTIKNAKKDNKPKIPIILIANHITAETLPFQTYAARSNIFKDMEIDHIEFLSWDALQYALSTSSVQKFTEKLLERKSSQNTTIKEVMSFALDKDKPAHSYEYLKDIEYDIFGRNFG